MTIESFKKGLDKYNEKEMAEFMDDDEYPTATIRVRVITEDWEYGYSDYSFEYKTPEDFTKNLLSDINGLCERNLITLKDVEKIQAYIHFYDDSDNSCEDFFDFDIEWK